MGFPTQNTYDSCAVINVALTSSYATPTPPAKPSAVHRLMCSSAAAWSYSTDGTNGIDVPANTVITIDLWNPFLTVNGSKLQFKSAGGTTLQIAVFGSNAG